MPLLRSAIGRGSLRLTRVGVVVDVDVCAVSVAVLGEADSTAICQLRSQIDAARLSGKPRRQQPPFRNVKFASLSMNLTSDFVARFLHFHVDFGSSVWIGSTLRRQYATHRDGWCHGFRLPQ